jgi:diacylglycerol O-acyltransferase / wax synthase
MGESGSDALEELRYWGHDPELNPLDALMWRTERPPANSWTGVVLMIFDSTPKWAQVVEAHEWASHVVPRFMEKVVEPVIPVGPPVWTCDPNFDLSYHLRRVRLPRPGSIRQLLEIAQTQGVIPLDRNRPPWVGLFVEGVEGGRSAYVMQAHHVLMDGAGATQLFARIMGRRRESHPGPLPEWTEKRPTFTPVRATSSGISRVVKNIPAVAGKVGAALANATAHPLQAATYARSAARVVAPQSDTLPDSVKVGARTAWRFGALECELTDLKKAGAAVGGTVNDAFVSAVLGGLREYYKSQGTDLPDIPISMPVSVRRTDDRMGGNRFTGAFFTAPAGIEDPAERIRILHDRVLAVRSEPALDVMGSVTPLLNFAPSSVVSTALQQLTTSALVTTSSWPGLTEPAYLAGARIDKMFVFGPLPGASMCAAMCSHVGTCCIGINVDGAAFPNIDSLWAAMQQGLDQVLALGK